MRSFSLRGVSFIDVIIGAALMLIIFLGLFGILRASLLVTSAAKAKAGATVVANTQMEYIRSLPYNSIGTSGGIPSGIIPQNSVTTLNGVSYTMRTFIIYADDPADGEGLADENSITNDYKRIKVSVTYTLQSRSYEVVLVSNQAPPGVESTVGGGTLRIEVVNTVGTIIPGASVRVKNSATTPEIDVTTFSDATSVVLFSGAPPSTEYDITVTKEGYSSSGTYERDAVNINPTPGFLTVAEAQTTTGIFSIDVLAALTIRTFSPPTTDSFFDTFSDSSQLALQTNTVISGGTLVLTGIPGTYATNGDAHSISVTPATIVAWSNITATLATTTSTDAFIQILDDSGVPLPDVLVPGNSMGLSVFPIDISGVSTTTYPTLILKAVLSSSDIMETSMVSDWTLSYTIEKTSLPNVAFTLTGGKTIGSMIDGTPISKTIVSTTTDASGVRMLSLESDLYQLSVPDYSIQSANPEPPYELLPGTVLGAELILSP